MNKGGNYFLQEADEEPYRYETRAADPAAGPEAEAGVGHACGTRQRRCQALVPRRHTDLDTKSTKVSRQSNCIYAACAYE